MRNEPYYESSNISMRLPSLPLNVPRKAVIGVIMLVALLAFEIFNFDTTRYALENLLGPVTFLSLKWATILAVAFCAIDFAGLIRLFTPERGGDEPREVWYLMGAWLLGATMNAVMTWWAVSLTLLNHDFGNEVLSREQLLRYVPIFVAVLVWLTRILFIGAFTIAGEHIFDLSGMGNGRSGNSGSGSAPKRGGQKQVEAPKRKPATRSAASRSTSAQATQPARAKPGATPIRTPPAPAPQPAASTPVPAQPARERNSRVRQRPPVPNGRVRRVNGGSGSFNARPKGQH